MVSALDKKKVEIKKAIEEMGKFEKSTRTTDTYNAMDANNVKIAVSFKGNNLKIAAKSNGRSFPIESVLIRDLNIEKMVKYLNWRLTVKAKPKEEIEETKEESDE